MVICSLYEDPEQVKKFQKSEVLASQFKQKSMGQKSDGKQDRQQNKKTNG